jgi:kelch-like protein 20
MYAVGGQHYSDQDGVSCINIVERYDPKENRWTRVAPMSTRRLGVAVAVLNGFLYAVGGSDGTSPLNTVERYDPSANHWKAMPSMGTRRKDLGVSAFQDKLFAGMYFELKLNQIIKTSQISEHYKFCCF